MDDVDFYPGFYGEDPPDVSGRHVIIVDFSYKEPIMRDIIEKAKSVIVLDHHASAERDLSRILSDTIIFDMTRSGAGMAWDYFHPGVPRPPLVQHIQDRDLWKFEIDGTREAFATIASYEYTFENWDKLADMTPYRMVSEGVGIRRNKTKEIKEIISSSSRFMDIAGSMVQVVNIPHTMGSEACDIICNKNKNLPFSAYYYDTKKSRIFGLRSLKEGGADVSFIAGLYGGGGHKNAAGFSVPRDHHLAKL